ncbi:hypothetical protein D9M68_813090 [compost metagenome]|uniref:hypothetical protein n=1 Tax=unclassified Hydrogenophaga TaxID=2610897 RepID=UPI0006F7D180|nr:hypothetical protein [Hydrogenophaga sp. Root209]KRB98981.1 hypothetical protein ASE11_11715 [Hydrogenophaga sp. Root209]
MSQVPTRQLRETAPTALAAVICHARDASQSWPHNLADDALRVMAVQLFRHFEARQSGISAPH